MNVIRDISLILLAVESLVLCIIPLLLVGALVYALWWLGRRERLPAWLKVAQAYVLLGKSYIELAMAWIARPIFILHSISSTVAGWFGALGGTVHSGGGQ